jgi:hypothetical protein
VPSDESIAPGDPCAGTTIPQATAGTGALEIRFIVDRDDREALPDGESPAGDLRETLTLSHLATGGDLERQFSVIEPTDTRAPPSVSLDWRAPKDAPATGTLVRFAFVLRDGRGGADWTLRDLCVTP